MLFMTGLSTISFIVCIFVLTESPIWLLINDRKQEAIAVLNYIGRVNGVSERIPLNANFVECKTRDTNGSTRDGPEADTTPVKAKRIANISQLVTNHLSMNQTLDKTKG